MRNQWLLLIVLAVALVVFVKFPAVIISPNSAEGLFSFDVELERALVGVGEPLGVTTYLVGKYPQWEAGWGGWTYYYVDDFWLGSKFTQGNGGFGTNVIINSVQYQSIPTIDLGEGSHELSVVFGGIFGSANQQSASLSFCEGFGVSSLGCTNGVPAFIGYFLQDSTSCAYREFFAKSAGYSIIGTTLSGVQCSNTLFWNVLPAQDLSGSAPLRAKLDRQFCVGSCERDRFIINNTVQYVDRPVEVIKEVPIEVVKIMPVDVVSVQGFWDWLLAWLRGLQF